MKGCTKIQFRVLLILIVGPWMTSCTQDISFERTKWVETTDPVYPSVHRQLMLKDLTSNHKLVGLSSSQLVEYLGHPDAEDANIIVYRIAVDYGGDIDPVYSKELKFSYSKDSIITSFKISEWKK